MNQSLIFSNIVIVEDAILRIMYPSLLTKQRKTLYKLLREKKIKLFDVEKIQPRIDDVLCSILRHQNTNYEQLLQHTERYKAREILRPAVNKSLELAKGGKIRLSTLPLETGTVVKIIENWKPECKPCVIVGHNSEYSLENQKFKIRRKDKTCNEDLSDVQFGTFTVLGLSDHEKGKWVVQCKCGNREFRKAKSIKNPNNLNAVCEACMEIN